MFIQGASSQQNIFNPLDFFGELPIRLYFVASKYCSMEKLVSRLVMLFVISFIIPGRSIAQKSIDSLFPVRALSIAAPSPALLDSFVNFINKDLAAKKVNHIVLRIDYNFQYKSHPELVGQNALSLNQVKKIVTACKKNNISIIPQINLLGHQSWAGELGKLLQVYPQFDETPHVKMPENYKWPNDDGLYCKSYCPLHPQVHNIVFELVDEICEAFEAKAFHAGMDEVFYIGDDKCPRCKGLDKSVLFAQEVNRIRDHLFQKGRELWIWGDRLIDGRSTGIGMWEASFNDTHRAVDMISKDVIICDWHYERPDKTAVYFAMKGLRVISCAWRNPSIAVQQVQDMYRFRLGSSVQMKDRFLGVMETVWSPATGFLREYYYGNNVSQQGADTQFSVPKTFNSMFEETLKLASE